MRAEHLLLVGIDDKNLAYFHDTKHLNPLTGQMGTFPQQVWFCTYQLGSKNKKPDALCKQWDSLVSQLTRKSSVFGGTKISRRLREPVQFVPETRRQLAGLLLHSSTPSCPLSHLFLYHQGSKGNTIILVILDHFFKAQKWHIPQQRRPLGWYSICGVHGFPSDLVPN